MAIKPIPHRIEQHSNYDEIGTPPPGDVLTKTAGGWDAQTGGGGGPHTILSAEHTDTDELDTPNLGDVLTWDGAEWDAQPGGGGAPTTADYVTGSAQAGLSAELVLGTAVIMAGTEAARPAAALAGRLYFATDTTRIFRDTGAGWTTIGSLSLNDLSGDVSNAQIENGAVSLAKIANIATARILGRDTAGSGVVEELTGTEATALLDAFTSALKGLAPASGGGTTNFLRADGTWAAPAGGGGAPSDAQYVVLAANGSLSDERILTEGDGLQIVDAGAGAAVTISTQTFLTERLVVAQRTYTNLGAGPTEASTADRVMMDLTNADEVRLVCSINVAGVTGDLKAQYSPDATTNWFDLTTLIDISTTGDKSSSWQAVPAGAKQLVHIRLVGVNGNTTEDPQCRPGAGVEFR